MSSTKKADQDLVKDCLRHIWEAPDCDNPEEHLKKSLALCARMSIAGAGALVPIHENPVFLLRVFNTSRATEPGEKVKAVRVITECGSGDGSPNAKFPHDDYIHALIGETGVVESVEDEGDVLNVRFDKTGTSTIVHSTEVVLVEEQYRES